MLARVVAVAFGGILMGSGQAGAEEKPAVDWLFIQSASAMSFDGETMLLTGVEAGTMAFSDRPYRLAIEVPTTGFVDLWADPRAFGSSPPNAGLSGTVDGRLANVVVTLSNPRFEGESLRYDVAVVGGDMPKAAADVTLLVDALPTAVNGQITDAVAQPNTKVLGDAPAEAMGGVYQTLSTSSALASAGAGTAK